MFGFPDIVRFSWSTVPKCLNGTLVMTVKEDSAYVENLRTKNIMNRKDKGLDKDLWEMPILNKK